MQELDGFVPVFENAILTGNQNAYTPYFEVGDNNALAVAVTVISLATGPLAVHVIGSNNLTHWLQRTSGNQICDSSITVPSAPGFAITNVGQITTTYIGLKASLTAGSCLLNIRIKLLKR